MILRKGPFLACLLLLLAISIVPLISPQLPRAYASGITRVQPCVSGSAVSGSSFAVTLSSSPVDGDALVLAGGRLSAGSISGVSSTGASWSSAVSVSDGQNEAYATIWYALNVSGAGKIITISLSGGQFGESATVCEYSGIALSNALDVTASHANHGARPQTVDSGTTGATNSANELFVASLIAGNAIGYDSNVFSQSPSNGFSVVGVVADGSYEVGEYAEKIVSTIGVTANVGDSFGGGNPETIYWAGAIATFKAAPPPPASINLNPTSGNPSSMVTVTGANFNVADTCSSPASTTSNPTGLIGPISSCSFSAGALSLVFQVNPAANVGSYMVTITGSTVDSASASFIVPVPTTTTTIIASTSTVTITPPVTTVTAPSVTATNTPTVTDTATTTNTGTVSTTRTITIVTAASTVTTTPTATTTATVTNIATQSATITSTSTIPATVTATAIVTNFDTTTSTVTVTELTVASTVTTTPTVTAATVTVTPIAIATSTSTQTSTTTVTTTQVSTVTNVSTQTVTVTTTTSSTTTVTHTGTVSKSATATTTNTTTKTSIRTTTTFVSTTRTGTSTRSTVTTTTSTHTVTITKSTTTTTTTTT